MNNRDGLATCKKKCCCMGLVGKPLGFLQLGNVFVFLSGSPPYSIGRVSTIGYRGPWFPPGSHLFSGSCFSSNIYLSPNTVYTTCSLCEKGLLLKKRYVL